MDSLQTIKVGELNKDSNTSSPKQITNYINSIISAESVALGGNEKEYPDIYNKAKGCSIAIGRNSQAENFGVAIGEKAYANLAFAIGPDAYATNNSLALGRYARATGVGAVQLNGNEDKKIVNNDSYTLKFYAGGNNNVTIVDNSGKIPLATSATKLTSNGGSTTIPVYFNNGVPVEITSYSGKAATAGTADKATTAGSCTGNAATATKLQTAHKIGGTSFDGTQDINLSATFATTAETCTGNAATATKLTSNDGSTTIPVYFNNGVPVAITSYSGKADTAGTADQADKVKCVGIGSSNDYVQLSVCTTAPTTETAQDGILYLVVES